MKADHLSFKRAAGISLTGLVLQLVMGFTLLMNASVFKDPSGLSGSLFILAGALVWLVLAVVFDQHRRERIEALEAESLAQAGARESSVFGDRADDLNIAAKRLGWMHRVLIPVVSIVFALTLAGLGVWTFNDGQRLLDKELFRSHTQPGWPITIGLVLAFIGFVFGRYTSALGRQAGWAIIRAGAAMSAGAALVGLAIAVGHFVDHWVGPDVVARSMVIAIPVVMFVIAAETVLNFLLGLYRPRRAGEVPRAAFESRILGFLAAPDKIAESIGGALNYQFGFDVTGSWFYQLLSRSLPALVIVGLGVTWSLTCLSIVQPNEQGLRIRMGSQIGERLEPGPYLKLPWPLERIERYRATTVRRVNLGGDQPKVRNSILWTNDHGVEEAYFIVQPSTDGAGTLARNANDVSVVSVEVPLLYEVSDLAAFEQLASPDQRERIIIATARREVFKYLATQGLDSVLGKGRGEISVALRREVEAALGRLRDGKGAGIKVIHVGIEGVHPPRDTAEMFEEVVQSHQKRVGNIQTSDRLANAMLIKVAGSVEAAHEIVKAIDAAERARDAGRPAAEVAELELRAEDLLTKAGGTAAAKLYTAKAERWQTHLKARARAEAYAGQLASFEACPEYYTAKVYFDALGEVISKSRLYVVADDADRLWIETDLKDTGVTGNLFKDNAKRPDAAE